MKVVDLALGSTATRAEAAAVLDAAAAVGLCSPGQAATLQDGLRSPQGELHADAPEFTPGAPCLVG